MTSSVLAVLCQVSAHGSSQASRSGYFNLKFRRKPQNYPIGKFILHYRRRFAIISRTGHMHDGNPSDSHQLTTGAGRLLFPNNTVVVHPLHTKNYGATLPSQTPCPAGSARSSKFVGAPKPPAAWPCKPMSKAALRTFCSECSICTIWRCKKTETAFAAV